MKKGRIGRRKVFTIIIAGILASIAVPLYLHYTETTKVRETLGIIKAIITSQKVEKSRTGKYYSASTIQDFKNKGIDITNIKFYTYKTTATPNDGFTVTATPTDASGAAGGPITYTYPLPEIILDDMLLTQS